MYEILLAVDTDESRAHSMAKTVSNLPVEPSQMVVTVTHVFTDNPEGMSIAKLGPARTVKNILENAGIEVRLEESSGDPTEEILSIAARNDVDLLCLAGRKRSPTGKALFGSVTQAVILGTDRPVLVAGTAEYGGHA